MPHMSVLCVCADRARPQVSKAWEPRVRASFTSPMAMLATASMWWAMLCSQLGAFAGLFPSARLDIVRAMTGFLVPLSQVRRHTRQTYTAEISGLVSLSRAPAAPAGPRLGCPRRASLHASHACLIRPAACICHCIPTQCGKELTRTLLQAGRGRLPAMRALSGCAHSPVSVCNRGAGAGRVLAAAGTSLHGHIRLVGGHQRRARGRGAVGGARAPAQQQRPRALCSCPGCAAGRAGSCAHRSASIRMRACMACMRDVGAARTHTRAARRRSVQARGHACVCTRVDTPHACRRRINGVRAHAAAGASWLAARRQSGGGNRGRAAAVCGARPDGPWVARTARQGGAAGDGRGLVGAVHRHQDVC